MICGGRAGAGFGGFGVGGAAAVKAMAGPVPRSKTGTHGPQISVPG